MVPIGGLLHSIRGSASAALCGRASTTFPGDTGQRQRRAGVGRRL